MTKHGVTRVLEHGVSEGCPSAKENDGTRNTQADEYWSHAGTVFFAASVALLSVRSAAHLCRSSTSTLSIGRPVALLSHVRSSSSTLSTESARSVVIACEGGLVYFEHGETRSVVIT